MQTVDEGAAELVAGEVDIYSMFEIEVPVSSAIPQGVRSGAASADEAAGEIVGLDFKCLDKNSVPRTASSPDAGARRLCKKKRQQAAKREL